MRTTKLRLALLPIAAAVLALTACGGDDSSSSSTSQDNRYIAALKMAGIDTNDRDALIKEGHQVCDDLKAGKQVLDFGDPGSGADAGRQATIAGAAVGAFCPDQQGKLVPTMPDLPSMPEMPAMPTG